MNTLMLVCASAASLALGVLAAYGVCWLAFTIFRVHSQSVAAARVAKVNLNAEAPASQV
ncbi:hypothetical protein [Silvibacterium sp.]|uniref:hypothetical protein n=1 Tax=Silvibacterium sp. TaxID=1964179 RepID=UPI0039E5CB31